MTKLPAGMSPAYQRLRDAREARRTQVEQAAGWTNQPARGWSRANRRKHHLKTRARRHHQGRRH